MGKVKIDIAIIGFQKAGTTSIQRYIGQQVGIRTHLQKEMTYFADKDEYDHGWEIALKRYFPNYKGNYRLLIKHATLIRHEASIKRLYEHNPQAKLIVCLRDPVQRAYSSYLMEKANGNQNQSFDKVIIEAFENHSKGISDWRYNVFIRLGEYINYIEVLLKYFPQEQFYLLWIEEFYKNTEGELEKLCTWLGIEQVNKDIVRQLHNTYKVARSGFLAKIISNILNEKSLLKRSLKAIVPLHKQNQIGEMLRKLNKKTAKKEQLDSKTKEFLIAHFEPFNERLYKIIQEIG